MKINVDFLILNFKDPAGGSIHAGEILTKGEIEQFNKMRFSKRRREWLQGRFTAKELLKRSLAAQSRLKHDEIIIANENEGAPYYMLAGKDRPPASLSISHRDEIVFCAVSADPGISVGVDVEKIEPRSDVFVKDYFTQKEIALVNACRNQRRVLMVNLIWSAKEAMLKSLHKGLRMDTRCVEIQSVRGLDGGGGKAGNCWQIMEVRSPIDHEGKWSAWWRAFDGYVFSISLLDKDNKDREIYLHSVSAAPASEQVNDRVAIP